jgi:hypothetical protein
MPCNRLRIVSVRTWLLEFLSISDSNLQNRRLHEIILIDPDISDFCPNSSDE